MSELFARFSPVLSSATEAQIREDPTLAGQLSLSKAAPLEVFYAPFEHIQRGAKIVIAGITPGLQQAANALVEARKYILAGADDREALRAVKVHASFSGPMRTNLVSMLDFIGMHKWVGLQSCADLWTSHSHLAHFTSALRYPVLLAGKNYSGTPAMQTTPLLLSCIMEHLKEEALALRGAIWVPLGPAATQGVNVLATKGVLSPRNILAGLPHPSGANAERIAYFIGKKAREMLSSKTNADTLDGVRSKLMLQVAALPM